MILGVNLGYHSKKLYQLINDQYTVRTDEAFVLPLVHSLKTYDSFLFIDKQRLMCIIYTMDLTNELI